MRLLKYPEIKTSIETGLPVPEYPLIADNEMRLDDVWVAATTVSIG
jgi:hypothetical protein